MPLPSMRRPDTAQRRWGIRRALLYGAILGALAALIKIFVPGAEQRGTVAMVLEILGAAAVFALLCAIAAALRNRVLRQLFSEEHD